MLEEVNYLLDHFRNKALCSLARQYDKCKSEMSNQKLYGSNELAAK